MKSYNKLPETKQHMSEYVQLCNCLKRVKYFVSQPMKFQSGNIIQRDINNQTSCSRQNMPLVNLYVLQ
jgi:hypothetical protein